MTELGPALATAWRFSLVLAEAGKYGWRCVARLAVSAGGAS
jgi:hypothetical protein